MTERWRAEHGRSVSSKLVNIQARNPSPACWLCVWMQAPASLILNAFQKSGVHALSFSGTPSRLPLRRNVRSEPDVGIDGWG